MYRLRLLVVAFLLAALPASAADVTGNLRAASTLTATYMATTAAFTPATAATDIFTITGSSSKTIRVWRIIVSGTQTTAGSIGTIVLIKRSVADTLGTPVTSTKVPLDSSDAAATAVVQHYTANPTTGTAVGTIVGPRILLPAPATVTSVWPNASFLDWDFCGLGVKPVVLRGTAEALCVNMGGGTLPTGAANFNVVILWTEE